MEKFVYRGPQKKLLKALGDSLPDYSYSYFQKLLRKGDIKINGVRTKSDVVLCGGEELTVYCTPYVFRPEKVFENEFIYVFNKYLGISSEQYAEKIKKVFPDAVLCHRLDTNTIGLIIFAKGNEIFEKIKGAFSEHLIEKHYYAEVFGAFPDEIKYVDYAQKDEEKGIVKVFSADGKNRREMISCCKKISTNGDISQVDVEAVTGRTHQIRAQLAFHGFPIVGDGKYGDEKKNRMCHTHVQHLCAYKIIFHCGSFSSFSSMDGLIVQIPYPKF